jgi:2-methylcitrate dehydratase
MSDSTSRLFAQYVAATSYHHLAPEVVHEVKRRILDSLGVSLLAFDAEPARIGRELARDYPTANGPTVLGTAWRTTPDLAAFANGVLVRYLDFNDTYAKIDVVHPADMIPPLLSLAEMRNLSGATLITAVAIAYELSVTLCDAASLRKHLWDHAEYIAIGMAAGAAKLLGLSPAATEHAIAIATVPHASMRQTRVGELSMWKGAAAADACRNAVFAALLAEKGMTGPFQPFEGEMGFFRLLTHQPFDSAALAGLRDQQPPRRILETHIKYWPMEYAIQSPVDAALRIRGQTGGAEIASVHIDTFQQVYSLVVKDPEKWNPMTRETADHSMPYLVVAALEDGEVTPRTFDPARFRSPKTLEFLARHVTAADRADLTAGFPEGMPSAVTVTLADGRTFQEEVRYPRGHARNPMTDDEVIAKFATCVAGRLDSEQAERLRDAVWTLETSPDVAALPPLCRLISGPAPG